MKCDIKKLKNKMNDDEKRQALNIMEKLKEHPITKIFYDIKPSGNSENDASSSPSISLNQIKSKIIDNEITFSEWVKQIDQVWSNKSNFDEKHLKYHPIVMKECKQIFEKLIGRSNNDSIKNWCSNVYRLHSEQIKFASHPPRKLFSIANQQESFKKIDNQKLVPISNAEIKAFLQALSMVQSEDIYHGLVNITTELQPEMKPSNTNGLEVELYKLELNTFRALIDYLKVELEKQGDHYPRLS